MKAGIHIFSFTILTILLLACNSNEQDTDTPTTVYDSTNVPIEEPHIHGNDTVDVYSNERFKNVWVEKVNDTSYRITGQAQVFEASFNWVLTNGETDIRSGYGTTDAGAPAFGHFSFEMSIPKKNAGEGLHLVLFESSAKDGSRQFELPLLLP